MNVRENINQCCSCKWYNDTMLHDERAPDATWLKQKEQAIRCKTLKSTQSDTKEPIYSRLRVYILCCWWCLLFFSLSVIKACLCSPGLLLGLTWQKCVFARKHKERRLTFCCSPVRCPCSSSPGTWASPPACRWRSGRRSPGSGSRPAAPPLQPPCSPRSGVRLGVARSRPPEPRSRRPSLLLRSVSALGKLRQDA